MPPGTIVDGIAHNLAIPSFGGVGEVVDAWTVSRGAVVGHDGSEFGLGILPSVLVGFAWTCVESIVFTSVVVSLLCSVKRECVS